MPSPGKPRLTLVIALEPRRRWPVRACRLKRAANGPGVLKVGRTCAPKYQRAGRMARWSVVAVDVAGGRQPGHGHADHRAHGTARALAFAEARYLDAVKTSLRGSRFELDKVDGVAILERVSLPTVRRRADRSRSRATRSAGEAETAGGFECRSLTAVSSVPGIELAKVDYTAPATAAVAPAEVSYRFR